MFSKQLSNVLRLYLIFLDYSLTKKGFFNFIEKIWPKIKKFLFKNKILRLINLKKLPFLV